MAKKILIYWRDIPSQVIIQKGRTRAKLALSSRFQEAIDSAAMRAGKGSSEAYLSEWRRETSVCELKSAPEIMAQEEAEKLEAGFSDENLQQMIRSHGVAVEQH